MQSYLMPETKCSLIFPKGNPSHPFLHRYRSGNVVKRLILNLTVLFTLHTSLLSSTTSSPFASAFPINRLPRVVPNANRQYRLDHTLIFSKKGMNVATDLKRSGVGGDTPNSSSLYAPPGLQMTRKQTNQEMTPFDEETSLPISSKKDDSLSISSEQQTSPDPENTSQPITSLLLLNFVAVIWGSQHSVIKLVLQAAEGESASLSVAGFTFARFSLALTAVVMYTPSFLPVLRRWFKKGEEGGYDALTQEEVNGVESPDEDKSSVPFMLMEDNDESPDLEATEFASTDNSVLGREKDKDDLAVLAWRWGLELGLWMFLGYAFQAIGLQYTTAQRSGFLLYLNVKFVPFFAYILLQRRISLPTWASAGAAVLGTFLICTDIPSTAIATAFNIGDVWCIGAAAMSAMFILRLEAAGKEATNAAALNAACLWTVTIVSAIWCMIDSGMALAGTPAVAGAGGMNTVWAVLAAPFLCSLRIIKAQPIAMLYLGLVTTALANYIQTKAQRGVTAERASLIYAMDPVYGAVFSFFILGETLGVKGLIGAGLISVAAILNALLDFGKSASGEVDEEDPVSCNTDVFPDEGR